MMMKKITFRLTDAEYKRVELVARLVEKSVPSFLRDIALKEVNTEIVEIALNLYKNDRIGLKKAWLLSGLPFHAFLNMLAERNIEPNIPDDLVDAMIENVKKLRFEDVFPGKTKEELRKLIHYYED
jgi:predicted HTH domain antitoxin